ncbi:hypothetical protein JB92DRAFT_3119329 [Gautieria morchelliformis]|nr:hypothetical protein JB92DRAFT_3119329 [Gautieria morchelliformis]
MASVLAQKAGLSLFEKHLQNYEPADPLYETYTDKNGKTRQRKRELPPGLSNRDAKILRKVKKRARRLDRSLSICGMRFGWTFIIGLVPVAGDAVNAGMSYILVVKKAEQAEIPGWLLRRMLMNNFLSAGVGLVPVVGDVVVATFKANSRNAALLEEYLRIRGEEHLKAVAKRSQNGSITPNAEPTTLGKKFGTISNIFRSRKEKTHAEPVSTEASTTAQINTPPPMAETQKK